MTRNSVIVFLFIAIGFSYFSFFKESVVLAVDCSVASAIVTQADKDSCQGELNQIEAQLAELLKKQNEQSKQSGTLKGDITLLTTQINALKTKIKARGLVIAQLKNSIKQKVSTITSLSEKIKREHESLAQLLRNTNEFDNENITHLILSDATISDYYSDLESYTSIKQAVKSSVDTINGVKTETEIQKKDLEVKQDAETDAQVELQNAQKKVAQSEADKKQLLAISKQKESEYQKLAAAQKVKADKIRAALFNLRDSKAIPFETALEYANLASAKTGVRPAFILGIITQESNLGTDSGSCYLTDFTTGVGVSSKSGKVFKNVMKPSRDVVPFQTITAALGRDPLKTLVSCPIGGVGYGGAMGPAQFIPSTWQGMADSVASALGIAHPDPWNPKDAIMASALFLRDLGARNGSYTSEMKAACKYYGTGGSSCSYGLSVAKKATTIQTNIDFLLKN
ncbi:MAG: lytic murein transglycosylase [bacterium]